MRCKILDPSLFLSLLYLTCFSLLGMAQEKKGRLAGLVVNASSNQPIADVTVSAYAASDSTVIDFTYSDLKGQFAINLKQHDRVYLVFKHLNYQTKVEHISSFNRDTLSSLTTQLEQKTHEIEEVEITRFKEPVSFSGDTVIFSVDAFKMDSSTVVEDLLRKLPGLIIWSDKKITLNGKEINKVYVDGKPFFFGDQQFAIQNLPNYVVDRVKVYDINPKTPAGGKSTVLDIELKADKKTGMFGKGALGGGSDKRYNAEAMLARYTPIWRVAAVSNVNNINRINLRMENLLSDLSYNAASSLSSSSNIDVQGVFGSRTHAAEVNVNKGYNYTLNYLTNNINNDIVSTYALYGINNQTNNLSHTDRRNNKHQVEQRFDKRIGNKKSINANIKFATENSTNAITSNNNNIFSGNSYIGTSDIDQSDRIQSIIGQMAYQADFKTKLRRRVLFNLQYMLDYTDANSESKSESNTTAQLANGRTDDISFDRLQNSENTKNTHRITTSLNGVGAYILNPAVVNMNLSGDWTIDRGNLSQDVFDRNQTTPDAGYTLYNTPLSYATTRHRAEFKPGITFSKTFLRSQTNRYSNSWQFLTTLRAIIVDSKNSSSYFYHNFDLDYANFIPSASVEWNKEIPKSYSRKFTIEMLSETREPSFLVMAPLIDTTNLFYRALPNLGLKPELSRKYKATYNYTNIKKYGNAITAAIDYEKIGNTLSDSTYIEEEATLFKAINLDDSYAIGLSLKVNNTFNLFERAIKTSGEVNLRQSQIERYINSAKQRSDNTFLNAAARIFYQVNPASDLNFEVLYDGYRLERDEERYLSQNINYYLGYSIRLKSRWNLTSSMTRRYNNNVDAHAYICNVDITYKALKNKLGEVKFSIFDLFNNNLSITNYQNSIGVATQTTNNLKRYFMVSFAYYPRVF
ncbi:carboxypeptidase-like regulatory domain-containing protein [Sphingobacterium griseoflavum]|nr:carboxypeptidase-like regulatory domain-containing protein [Sphingobacterium griseoflavum]